MAPQKVRGIQGQPMGRPGCDGLISSLEELDIGPMPYGIGCVEKSRDRSIVVSLCDQGRGEGQDGAILEILGGSRLEKLDPAFGTRVVTIE